MRADHPTYRVVRKMVESGNAPGVVTLWKNMVAAWAEKATGPDADAVKAFLPLWRTRPFYTAAELAPIFPVLEVALGVTSRPGFQKSAALLENELKWARLPWREIDGRCYFLVEHIHHWRDAPLPALLEVLYAHG